MLKSALVQTAVLLILLSSVAHAQTKPRARDLGVPFDGTTGRFNAFTDVKGVEVGQGWSYHAHLWLGKKSRVRRERGICGGSSWCRLSEEAIRLFRAGEVMAIGVKRGQHAEGGVSPSRDYGDRVKMIAIFAKVMIL